MKWRDSVCGIEIPKNLVTFNKGLGSLASVLGAAPVGAAAARVASCECGWVEPTSDFSESMPHFVERGIQVFSADANWLTARRGQFRAALARPGVVTSTVAAAIKAQTERLLIFISGLYNRWSGDHKAWRNIHSIR